MATFEVDGSGVELVADQIEKFGETSLKTIDEILHKEGANEIKAEIQKLLPSSRRSWKGKKTPASATQPFRQENDMLSVTIKSKKPYNYLYFPDDGSNTKKHSGNQQFMRSGAENAADKIIELCTGKLTEGFTN